MHYALGTKKFMLCAILVRTVTTVYDSTLSTAATTTSSHRAQVSGTPKAKSCTAERQREREGERERQRDRQRERERERERETERDVNTIAIIIYELLAYTIPVIAD